jgi:hypothetical protein
MINNANKPKYTHIIHYLKQYKNLPMTTICATKNDANRINADNWLGNKRRSDDSESIKG